MSGVAMIRVELKYCEGCGGLLVRRVGTEATYCAKCNERLRELAPSRPAKRRGRPPKVQPVVMTAAELRRQRAEEAEARERQGLEDDLVPEIEAVADVEAEAGVQTDSEIRTAVEVVSAAETEGMAELMAVRKSPMSVRFTSDMGRMA